MDALRGERRDRLGGAPRPGPGADHGRLRRRQRQAPASRGLVTIGGVGAVWPWLLRQRCDGRGSLPLAFERQGFGHRFIPSPGDQRMPKAQLRQARQLFLAGPHPVGIKHAAADRVPFRSEEMPVPLIPARHAGLPVLDDHAMRKREPEFPGDIPHDPGHLHAVDSSPRAHFEVPNCVAFSGFGSIPLHGSEVLGVTVKNRDPLVCRAVKHMAHQFGDIQRHAQTGRLDDHRRPR